MRSIAACASATARANHSLRIGVEIQYGQFIAVGGAFPRPKTGGLDAATRVESSVESYLPIPMGVNR
jgi:hypothetical protein